ncbi:hypothetical protein HZ326_19756 [Fusarium oxysporum f. sp. albedinis]|nr:hypothetical protein HZ326_19756 [Fusarium oxysporum f. sp. albedinis]
MVKIATVIATVIALFNNLASADPAIRITGLGCGLYDGNGNSVFTLKSRTVITHSENGNVVCQATVTPSTAGKARTFNFKNTNSERQGCAHACRSERAEKVCDWLKDMGYT